MVQSFVFRRNNNSAACLEEENYEETIRNSIQWKIHTANHETPAECGDLGSDFNPRNGRPILNPGTTMNGKNIWNWWKRSWSYTCQCIVAKYLCMMGHHAIGQKSPRTISRRKISNCWNGREIARTLIQLRISGQNWRMELLRSIQPVFHPLLRPSSHPGFSTCPQNCAENSSRVCRDGSGRCRRPKEDIQSAEFWYFYVKWILIYKHDADLWKL